MSPNCEQVTGLNGIGSQTPLMGYVTAGPVRAQLTGEILSGSVYVCTPPIQATDIFETFGIQQPWNGPLANLEITVGGAAGEFSSVASLFFWGGGWVGWYPNCFFYQDQGPNLEFALIPFLFFFLSLSLSFVPVLCV